MKLQAQVGDDKHEVEIGHDGDKLRARVDDRVYDIEASEPEPNVFLLKNDGQISQVFISPRKNDRESFAARIGAVELDITLTDPKRLRGSSVSDHDIGGKAEIRTAMPGKVVRILVAAGAEVQKGDGIMVIEAMKMQNEMKSPKDGVVSEIRVGEGDTVGAGDILMVIE